MLSILQASFHLIVCLVNLALYFDKDVEKLPAMYQTDFKSGLTEERYKQLKAHYGINKLPESPKPSILKMLFTQLSDFIVVILIVVTIVQFATKDINAAIVLLIVVVINVAIGFSQEYKATKAIDALSSLTIPTATVIRSGIQLSVESSDLVPGDVVVLNEGDAIPADLRLFEISQLEIIEAVLTGESVPTEKKISRIKKRSRKLPLGDCKGNAFMSTIVAKGRGRGVVVRTGLNTEIGRINDAIVSQPHQTTAIQRNLANLGKWLILVAIVLCAAIIGMGVAWGNDIGKTIKIGVALAVSVVPEGLVAVVTGILILI